MLDAAENFDENQNETEESREEPILDFQDDIEAILRSVATYINVAIKRQVGGAIIIAHNIK